MTLSEYIEQNSIKKGSAVNDLGCSLMTFYRWMNGESIPTASNMRNIIAWSNGAVQASDFYPTNKMEDSE